MVSPIPLHSANHIPAKHTNKKKSTKLQKKTTGYRWTRFFASWFTGFFTFAMRSTKYIKPNSKFIRQRAHEIVTINVGNMVLFLSIVAWSDWKILSREDIPPNIIKERAVKTAIKLNCTPFVRQCDILSNKWGVLLCQKEYQTNDIRQNSKNW